MRQTPTTRVTTCALPFLLLALALFSSSAHAVVLAVGNGNTAAPGDDPGWNYVGLSTTGNASIVYLGNRYAISANHVTIGATVQLRQGGVFQSFNVDPNAFGVGVSKLRPTSSDSSLSDLQIFRLTTDPGLAPLPIAPSSPSIGADVRMIGNGQYHGTDVLWRVTGTFPNYTWNEVPPDPGPANAAGFNLTGRTVRWGDNEVDSIGASVISIGGFGTIDYFTTEFNHSTYFPGGTIFASEAQAVNGDSGGGVFTKIGGTWYLSGLMHAQGTFEDQPASTAVFGNLSYISDLSQYRSQFISLIPEPASVSLLAFGGLAAMGMARRIRRFAA